MRFTLPVFQKPSFLVALVFSSSLIVAGSAQGQTTVSIQAGTSLSTQGSEVDYEGPLDVGYGTGLAVRASVYLPLPGILGLQIGATYVQKRVPVQGMWFDDLLGAEIDIASMSDTRFLQLPVLLRITPKLQGPLSPRFMVGPALSFALNCSQSTNSTITHTNGAIYKGLSEFDGCNENDHRIVELGITAGLGINMAVTQSLSLTLDFLYDYGLSSINAIKGFDTRNRAFAIMAGVAFPIR